jgi:ATP-dependent Zn protease
VSFSVNNLFYACFKRVQVSSGVTDDLRQATNMARHMVMQCGLNDAQ